MSQSWTLKNYIDLGINGACTICFVLCTVGIIYMTCRAYQRNKMFANLSNNLVVTFIISTLLCKFPHFSNVFLC